MSTRRLPICRCGARSAAHMIADLTLPFGRVLHDYLA
jgi:acetoacetate decarboxylase